VVQSLLVPMMFFLPDTATTGTMFIHPTVTELVPSVFGALKPLD